jgi:plasmid stabilization system protein ParE
MTLSVAFDPQAQHDLDDIFEYIADHASVATARAFTGRLEAYCLGFETFPERGTRRDDIRPGLRTVGFRRKATVAFTIKEDRVVILRILYGGRNVDAFLDRDD